MLLSAAVTSAGSAPATLDTTLAAEETGAGGTQTLGAASSASSGGSSGPQASARAGRGSVDAEAPSAGPAPHEASLPSLDPAAVPGSGPSPPAGAGEATDWLVAIGSLGGAISVAVSGGALVVTVGGSASIRPLATVASLTIIGGPGGDALTLDASAAGLTIPIFFAGAGGNDIVYGPAIDATWTISGPGAGTVGALRFTGVEALAGARDNKDTFVFEPGGAIAGTIDGGDGGFDTLVLAGGAFTSIDSTITGPQSGRSAGTAT